MQIRRTAATWEVWAPAKLNLFLEVLARRADGYHEIETLMCPIDLYDTFYFTEDPTGRIELACDCDLQGRKSQAAEELPSGPANLVVRAVELLREAAGIQVGAGLRLVKRIPMAAGLGGGSSDAAAALAAANEGWKVGLSLAELEGLATRLGSDVAFFLGGGPAICRGRGELIEPLTGLGPMHFVVAHPPQGLRTADVYGACRPARAPLDSASLVDALRHGRLAEAGRRLHNRLQPAAAGLSSWIGRLADEFSQLDLWGHQMSGSGTSYFGLCRTARQARRAAERLRMRGVGQVYAVRSIC
jgi:4-diphosphocytidyl-2-C-methyl-D-erythritol kinase